MYALLCVSRGGLFIKPIFFVKDAPTLLGATLDVRESSMLGSRPC